jgi:hypothetical protein
MAGLIDLENFVSPENLESLRSNLVNLPAGETVSISSDDFRKLSGHDISEFCSEGRLMMGNLAAASNCSIDTTTGIAVFTKNQAQPVAGVRPSFSREGSQANRAEHAA